HNGFLRINNEKMSKSLGNFFTVREIGEKYDLQVIRFFMLSAHYRSPLNFSQELVEASKNGLERIKTAAARLEEAVSAGTLGDMTNTEKENAAIIDEFVSKYEEAMEDDLNTDDAIYVIFELVKHINTTVEKGTTTKAYADKAYDTLKQLCDILGINVKEEAVLLDEEIESLINERQEARKAKNFARADEIRSLLTEKGIILEDTREGVRWKRA
ncbi:MAG: class I tRNA ligase family protein, partial [Lachnospiraceae bacterium]|nr:class I tRNA ligase family protein [Lachnospiraceae bacterium]